MSRSAAHSASREGGQEREEKGRGRIRKETKIDIK
jgi:hypothetical protein